MRVSSNHLIGALVVVSLGCGAEMGADGHHSHETSIQNNDLSGRATATLKDPNGAELGTVDLNTLSGGKVKVEAKLAGLPAGIHGFHIHGAGHCEPHFGHTGGHYNPDGLPHGQHRGDLPVLFVSQDGTATLTFTTDRFTVDELFDADGSAFIIHAGPDNYANIPTRYWSTDDEVYGPDSATRATGDAGGRLGCGAVTR